MTRWSKLGVFAGSGDLPMKVAATCVSRSEPFHVIRIAGAAEKSLEKFPGDECAIGEIGKMLRILKDENCDAVVFAGVVRRPNFKTVKPDWRGAALLPKVLAAAAKGDGALLNVLVETVESEGLMVIGAEEVTEDLTASAGPIGNATPSAENFDDIRKAGDVIRSLGAFDIGQGAVVSNGLVLAVEAAEGTDAMLERCVALNKPNNAASRSGVLVKRPKPGQELRVDLPVIGPETVKRADAAGLSGIAIEAGVALIIDREEVKRLADEAGLFVYGFTDSEVRAQ